MVLLTKAVDDLVGFSPVSQAPGPFYAMLGQSDLSSNEGWVFACNPRDYSKGFAEMPSAMPSTATRGEQSSVKEL